MTIEENLALLIQEAERPLWLRLLRKQDKELFREALAEFGMGLEDRMKNKSRTSFLGGQRQVVTLLMCTLVTPKLLLLDRAYCCP